MDFIVKSKSKETLREHNSYLFDALHSLKDLYDDYFTENEWKLIYLAAEYHDYGKLSYYFQSLMDKKIKLPECMDEKKLKKLYSKKDNKNVPHGYLSPAFLDFKDLDKIFNEKELIMLVNAIAFHHTREYPFNNEELRLYIFEDLKPRFNNTPQAAYFRFIYKLGDKNSFRIEDNEWVPYAIIKGMLNKLDYWASSERLKPIEISNDISKLGIGALVHKELIFKYGSLREAQKYMKENKDKNIVIVAPTGAGKTEAALLWIDNEKAFYTLPLRVSINAIYERIKKSYNYPEECIGLLHSDAVAYLIEKEEESPIRKYEAAKSFSYPLTIGTIDQLFTFIYKYKGSEIILATLKYSKLIVDEIQAYAPDIIGKLIYGLKLLSKAGGKFAIITATLPPVFIHFMQQEGIPFEKPRIFLSEQIRHVCSYTKGEFNYELIVEDGKNKKVLVICNTVGKAQKVYEELNNKGVEIHLLHSHFKQSDKRYLEQKIMEFSVENDKHGVWISTQIVEASLNIDFDILYTEMCTADSLLQRMGRCFRLRDYIDVTANICIYDTGNGVKKKEDKGVYDKELYLRSVKYLKQYLEIPFDEHKKQEYIHQVYNTEKLVGTTFYNAIRDTINSCNGLIPGIFDREEAKKNFRNITSYSYIPYEIYNELNGYGRMDDLIDILNGEKSVKPEFFHLSLDKISDEEQRVMARKEIQDNVITTSYPLKSSSKQPIKGTKIYKIDSSYDFNKEGCSGKGLLKNEQGDNVL